MNTEQANGEWPGDFDDAAAVESALSDPPENEQLEAIDPDDLEQLARPITSHQLRVRLRDPNTGRHYINDNSTFRIPHTDHYEVRVALFDRSGRRVYLGPFRNKGGGNGYHSLIHREAVWDDSRLTHKSLVLWRGINGGAVWTDWANG